VKNATAVLFLWMHDMGLIYTAQSELPYYFQIKKRER